MLLLERRPQEATARRKFMEVRRATQDRLRQAYRIDFPELDEAGVGALVGLTIALADGFFIAQEAGEGELEAAFELMGTAILGAAKELAGGGRPTKEKGS